MDLALFFTISLFIMLTAEILFHKFAKGMMDNKENGRAPKVRSQKKNKANRANRVHRLKIL